MTPTYAWQIPTLVKEWLLQTTFVDVEHVWFVMNCGDSIGKADRHNQELCEKKNWTYMGTAQIVMPENYIAMFPVPDEKRGGKIIEAAEPAIEQAISCIQMTKKFPDRKGHFWDGLLSGLVNRLFYPLFGKSHTILCQGFLCRLWEMRVVMPVKQYPIGKRETCLGK